MEKIKKKYSKTDCLILGIGFLILGLFVLSIAIPIVYVVLASFMDPTVLNNQGLSFHIKDWTLDAYRRVLENEMIWRGFLNSFLYSLAFTAISVFITLLAAYPLSKKEFVGRKLFNLIFLITMFFGGGMIPTFILINQLHMVIQTTEKAAGTDQQPKKRFELYTKLQEYKKQLEEITHGEA